MVYPMLLDGGTDVMRFASILLLIVLPLLSSAAEKASALKALKALPENEAKNLARIEAHGGTPTPDQWHILVYNSEAEAGLKEYVVANGKLTASREVSQFAENLTAADVIGDKAMQVDSGRIAKLAKEYASANNGVAATLNYQLSKQEAVPVWKVSCFDKTGEMLGTLVVSATKGTVLSHDGFSLEPKSSKRTKAKLRLKTEAQPMVAVVNECSEEVEQEATEGEVADHPAEEEVRAEDDGELAAAEHRANNIASSRPRNREGGGTKQSAVGTRAGSSSRTTYRRSIHPPNPVTAVRRVTSPVRHIVRRILPF